MKKLFGFWVLPWSIAIILSTASQSQAVSIFNDLGTKHTFYITSEWAAHDHRELLQMQNLADLAGVHRKNLRLDAVNLESFYVGGIQRCDLPAGVGGGGSPPGPTGFSSKGSSRLASLHGGGPSGSQGGGGENGDKSSESRLSYNLEDEPVSPVLKEVSFLPPSDLPDGYVPAPPADAENGIPAVPEPATLMLVGSALAFLGGVHQRRKRLRD